MAGASFSECGSGRVLHADGAGGVPRCIRGGVYGYVHVFTPLFTALPRVNGQNRPFLHRVRKTLTPLPHRFAPFFLLLLFLTRRHTGDVELVELKRENSAVRKTVRCVNIKDIKQCGVV